MIVFSGQGCQICYESDCLIAGQVQVSKTNIEYIYRLDSVSAETYVMRKMFLEKLWCQ
jgi:hypothetical protein